LSLEYGTLVVLCAYSASSLKSDAQLGRWIDFMCLLITLVVVSAWLGAVVSPSEAWLPQRNARWPLLSAILPVVNPDRLGAYGSVLVIMGFLGRRDRKWPVVWYLIGLVGLLTLLAARSRSGAMGLAVGIAAVAWRSRRVSLALVIGTLVFPILLLTPIGSHLVTLYMRGQNTDQLAALSGRLPIWGTAFRSFSGLRWFYGFGAFAGPRFAVIPETGLGTLSSLHNTYIEATVELGVGGGLWTLAVMVSLWSGILKETDEDGHGHTVVGNQVLALLALVTVRSLFNTNVILYNDYIFWMTLTAVGAKRAWSARRSGGGHAWYSKLPGGLERLNARRPSGVTS